MELVYCVNMVGTVTFTHKKVLVNNKMDVIALEGWRELCICLFILPFCKKAANPTINN